MNRNAVKRFETFRSVFSIQLYVYYTFYRELCICYLNMYYKATDYMNNCIPNLLLFFLSSEWQ